MSTLAAIDALARARPFAGDGPVVLAAWYERKAVVLHHIATEDARSMSERDNYESMASTARARADRLLAEAVKGGAPR